MSRIENGQWIEPDVSYVEPLRNACACCGRPIARQYWQTTIDGTPRRFCDPAHADLFVSYWLPRYRQSDETLSID